MADFVFIRKSRNALSSVLHFVLNIFLGFGSVFVTLATGSWIVGIILVIVSKWRTFAVRPRYWLMNLKSNLVDIIVGVSFVLLAYTAGTELLPMHWLLAILYTVWLIWIKPGSTTVFTEIQALAAVLLGSAATTLLAAPYDAIFTVVPLFVIGYAAARHVISQNDDEKYRLLTFASGLIFAELGWLGHSWFIYYSFWETGLIIPQLSIILTLLSFAAVRLYRSLSLREGKLRFEEVAAPVIFALASIAVIVICFSEPIFKI